MFRSKYVLAAAVLLMCTTMVSCKKDEPLEGTASLTIVNMMRGTNTIIANFSGTEPIAYYGAPFLYFNTFTFYQNRFNSQSGTQTIGFFSMPDTTDKSQPVLIKTVDLPVASISSLFLIGSRTEPDALFLKDDVPYFPVTDSSGGFRFVNVLANSGAVSVNIKGDAAGSLVSSIAYKEASAFIKLPVKPGIDSYEFEFREAGTGTLIRSYITPFLNLFQPDQVNGWIWRSNTMALSGEKNGTGVNAPAVVRVNSF
ncbi:MAG: hypothetical protein ACTHMC_26690 [Pseudobacter sp.]|uniref:hypothetical protein n=1 Tax=Pseudobacter sp. TaxID=2045420 RepID=UPI003F7E857A